MRISAREVRSCTICGGAFLIVPKYPRLTCSATCDSERRKRLGEGDTKRQCKQCGAEFMVPASDIKWPRTGDYCSNPCRIAGLNSLPRKPAQTAPCRICGKPFRCKPCFKAPDSRGNSRGIYCSRTCMWTDDDYRKRRAAKHSPTKLEQWLFAVLDEQGMAYEKFATVGRYVPDAILTDYNVIIEVDGVVWHAKRIAYDQQRDVDLAAAGYVVMHYTDREITGIKKARKLIGEAIAEIRSGNAAYRPSPLYPVSRSAA